MKNNIKAIKQELLETINDLYIEYKLPPMNISDEEWDLYLHVVESHFMAHNNMDDFISEKKAVYIIVGVDVYGYKDIVLQEQLQ